MSDKKFIFIGILSLLASFGAGFAAGYSHMKKKFFKEYEVVDDAIVPLETTEVVVGRQADKKEEPPKLPETLKAEDKGNDYKEAMVEYSKISKTQNAIRRNPVIEDDIDDRDDYLEPYVIPKYEFENGNKHYSKVTVYYYKDNVMVEEGLENDPEYDGRRYLGMDPNEIFGAINDPDNDNEDVAYVRNDRVGIDYEVLRSSQSYGDEDK